eukprot:Rhum_TRINITY_DN12800_c0_g1::Rhum_TRINITY_DN12800_c0_g1_i1::g.54574::m.54574
MRLRFRPAASQLMLRNAGAAAAGAATTTTATAAARPAAAQQRRGVELGRINPIPMPKEVQAYAAALRHRDKLEEKQAERYEADMPAFSRTRLLEGMPSVRLWTARQRESAQVLEELVKASPEGRVSLAVAHSRGSFRVGLRALRAAGSQDDIIAWVVGHYLCGTIGRAELTCYGVRAVLRRFWYLFVAAAAGAAAFAAYFRQEIAQAPAVAAQVAETITDTVTEAAYEVGIIDEDTHAARAARRAAAAEASAAAGSPDGAGARAYSDGERFVGNAVGYAAPTAIATLCFGPAGTAAAAGCAATYVVLSSVEAKQPRSQPRLVA